MASTYTWSLASGTLPPGLSIDLGEDGLVNSLSGTPTTLGSYSFTVRITNDLSGAFDDQEFTLEIVPLNIELTPDIGSTVDYMFSASNPKLLLFDKQLLVNVTGQEYSVFYIPARKLRFRVDLGDGITTYEVPIHLASSLRPSSRRYLWRVSNNPTVIHEVLIV